ncbi:MAG: hypothetical protein IPJ17_00120 [Holophagales bacterium]|nr:MAG: hypothetical protein IPJ17_00120 [Holophagales bacterium]
MRHEWKRDLGSGSRLAARILLVLLTLPLVVLGAVVGGALAASRVRPRF